MAPDVVSLYEISKRRWITQPFKKMRFAGIRYFYYLRILFSSQAKLLQHYSDCIPTWPRLRIFSRPWRKFSRNVKTDTGINGTISKSRKMVIWVRTGIPQTALNRDLYRNSPEFWGVASKLQILIQWRWPFPKFFSAFLRVGPHCSSIVLPASFGVWASNVLQSREWSAWRKALCLKWFAVSFLTIEWYCFIQKCLYHICRQSYPCVSLNCTEM